MDEVTDAPDLRLAWRDRLPDAEQDPQVALQLAREANSRGEHMLALAVAEKALRRLSLVSDPGEAVPFRQQMALALARSGSTEEAIEVLRDSLVAAPEDGETLGLMGRLHKDLAEAAGAPGDAERHRRKALEFYGRGFAIERNAYCGINTAVLSALTGDGPRARSIATQILELPPEQDRLWAAATIAMVRMIRGERDGAREALRLADRAGALRRSDLAVVRREARRLAAALEGDAAVYDNCFQPAAVALFRGGGDGLGDSENIRLVRWLQENHVVCAWSAAASGAEADFLERAAASGVETCAVLPESLPREHCRRAVERASLLDFVSEGAVEAAAAEDLARSLAAARAVARANSWEVPLLTVSVEDPPGSWGQLASAPVVGRVAAAAATGRDRMRAVLCVSRADEAPEVRALWENHAARCGPVNGNGGPYLFGWSSMAEAGEAAVALLRHLQPAAGHRGCTFVLHACAQEPADTRVGEWAQKVYPGRIHATGRFADLAALEALRSFDLCYVGTIGCQAEPLGIRLYHLRERAAVTGVA